MSTQKKLVLNSWVVPLLANIFTTPKYPPRHFYRRWQIFYLNEDSRCVLSKCTVGKKIFGAKIQIFNWFHCFFGNIRTRKFLTKSNFRTKIGLLLQCGPLKYNFCLLWIDVKFRWCQQTFFTPFWLVSHDDPAFMKNRRCWCSFFRAECSHAKKAVGYKNR